MGGSIDAKMARLGADILTREVVWTLLVRLLLIIAGFLSSIVTARFLGPEGRGVFFYWTTLAAFAIQFGNLGLHSSNTFLLAKKRAQLSALAANSQWVALIGGIGLGGLLVMWLYYADAARADNWSMLWPVLLMIPSGLYFLLGTNLLVADNRIAEYNRFELVNRYAGLAVIFLVAWIWPAPETLLFGTSIVALVICLPLHRRLRKLGGSGEGSFKLIREGFGYSVRAYISAAIGFAVLRVNTLLLGNLSEPAMLGNWSIAAQLIDVIIVIPSAIAMVLLPKIMRSEQPYQLMKSQLRFTGLVLAVVCFLVVWLGRDLINMAYGERFSYAYTMLLWGLPGAFALGLTSIISQYLAAVGIPLALLWIWVVGLGLELGLAIWLIPGHGALGAMVSLSVAYVFIFGSLVILSAFHDHRKRMAVYG
jgi:antigen flippase